MSSRFWAVLRRLPEEMSLEELRRHNVEPHKDTVEAWLWYTGSRENL